MIFEKRIAKTEEVIVKALSEELCVSNAFAKILYLRGIKDEESALNFLNPNLNNMQSPYLIKGIKEAVERITAARDYGETVVIYGDYDADGISAVTVLYRCLKEFGLDAYAVIPERKNGYGLTAGVYEEVLENLNPDLIITVDCGIGSYKEVEELKDLGVDVIVTDHHQVPQIIPDCVVINCHIQGEVETYEHLCGAGVAYKLGKALIGDAADKYLDVVAVATIADSMPLTGENRIIVSEGLKIFKSGKAQKCLKVLAEECELKEYTTYSLTYSLVPRINAAGRMGDAYSALQLFLSDDVFEMRKLAASLTRYNQSRQSECEILYKSAKEKISPHSKEKIIAVYDESWSTGLIGIVAARLVEEYKKPVVMFSKSDGILHGSARTVGNINIFEAINSVVDLTLSFGGHAQAAGVTLKEENFGEFKRRLDEYITEHYDVSYFSQGVEVDMIIDEPFSLEFAKELERLEPCGVGNRRPCFAIECEEVNASPLKYGSPHVGFKTEQIDMLWFNGLDYIALLNSATPKYIVFEPNISTYMGRESLKGFARGMEVVFSDSERMRAEILYENLNAYDKHTQFKEINAFTARQMLVAAEKEVYGTLFVINNYSTFDKFSLEKFDKCAIKPMKNGNLNSVCYGFSGENAEGYKRIVYLDKPLFALPKEEVFVNTEYDGFTFADLNTDRQVLGDIYLKVKSSALSGSILNVALRNQFGYAPSEIVFALCVFKELGIIYDDNGYIKTDGSKRVSLESSEIYNVVQRCLKKS